MKTDVQFRFVLKPRYLSKNNIKVDLKERKETVCHEFIWLTTGNTAALLNTVMNTGLKKCKEFNFFFRRGHPVVL